MKVAKLATRSVLIYAGIVLAFESMVVVSAYFQVSDIGVPVLVLSTVEDDATSTDRVLARMELDGQLFVAANHWPRGWYNRALKHPEVQATVDGTKSNYTAVAATKEEWESVDAAYPFPLVVRALTGFPPRRMLRLDPR